MNDEKSCFDKFNFGLLNKDDSRKWKQKIEEFYRFLRGKKHKRLVKSLKSKLSREDAIFIIYFLQEITRIIPCQFEFCCICKDKVYDSYKGGCHSEISGKNYCEDHEDYSGMVFCEDCDTEVSKRQYSKRFNAYLCADCKKERLLPEIN